MIKLNLIWIFILIFLAISCQKRKYPADNVQLEKETIYFNGYVDNNPIVLKIGTDGYYCYSSYNQSADSIYIFKGELKKFNCNPCPLSLQVELSDYRQRSPGSPVQVDSALSTGSRGFIPGVSKIQTLKFSSNSNKEISSLRWDLSNGITSQDPDPPFEFGQPGPQTISLTVISKGGCESLVTSKIFVGGESGLFACSISDISQGNHSEFTPNIVGGKANYTYSWDFGDGGTSTLPAPPHDYQWGGSYPVKLQIRDAENHVCESNFIHVTGNDNSSCAANMSLSYGGSRRALFLNAARMQWTDQSNIILRSDSVAQPAESYFEILSSQNYEPNERGEAGRLLTLRFNVLLSGGGRKVWIRSDNTAITVSYK